METIEFKKKIEEFISSGSGYGSGSDWGSGEGSGYGSGSGSGYGYGYGSGSDWGSGSGSGEGSGYGSGLGSGYGSGYGPGSGSGSGEGSGLGSGYGSGEGSGLGSGYGSGSGSGLGSGSGIKSINGHTVYKVDNIPTVFFNIKGDIAKCATIAHNTELVPCFVVKGEGLFAHGETLHEAHNALQAKLLKRKPIEERIADFKAKFKEGEKYPASEFFNWHHILTGSCEFGRREFCRQHNIDLENGQYTVEDFIKLTKNAYGGEVISKI